MLIGGRMLNSFASPPDVPVDEDEAAAAAVLSATKRIIIRCEEINAFFQQILKPASRPAFACQALEDIDFCSHQTTGSIKDSSTGMLAVPQQSCGMCTMQGCQTVKFIGQLHKMGTKGADVATALLV
ncbi:hypothetical protein CFO_g1005 [Ceratocystis platani]|uniref:Uncharacterized protein n=1 Tax=Ceratocystis fimbriata f. sp. platani TaxID=88771 RepID=A0A0F8D1I9_CERFI|nr:hypothetical protein CFO_g1005 [Ceratocystis platani]